MTLAEAFRRIAGRPGGQGSPERGARYSEADGPRGIV